MSNSDKKKRCRFPWGDTNPQDIYIKGYVNGMRGFDPNDADVDYSLELTDDLWDIYFRLRQFSQTQCLELTDAQRNILDTIIEEFNYILRSEH